MGLFWDAKARLLSGGAERIAVLQGENADLAMHFSEWHEAFVRLAAPIQPLGGDISVPEDFLHRAGEVLYEYIDLLDSIPPLRAMISGALPITQTPEFYLTRISELYAEFFKEVVAVSAWSAANTHRFAEVERMKSGLESALDSARRTTFEMASIRAEFAQIEEDIRVKIGVAATFRESGVLDQRADNYAKGAIWWLCATLALVLCAAAFAVFNFTAASDRVWKDFTAAESIQLVSAKLIIAGAFAYAISQTFRVFIAHRHNEAVSRHRSDALRTYAQVVAAGETPEGRSILLQQAAVAIFQSQDTAFSKPSSQDATPTIVSNLMSGLDKKVS